MADRSLRASYRLQLNPDFTFADVERTLPYLKALGVSHVYASPMFQARKGSTHGYDITDHRRLNEQLGGEEGFARLAATIREAGLGLIVDFVPNHVGIGHDDNPWWLDVLAWGRRSRYAELFDIDWQPAKAALAGKLLVPLLGDHYGAILERGELQLGYDEGGFAVHYWDHRFPLTPPSYALVVGESSQSPRLDALLAELKGLGRPDAEAVFGGRLFEHAQELTAQLAELMREDETARSEVERAVARFRENAPSARRALHELLEAQWYRLAYFRVASDEINYRRFFNINELAGIRVELAEVFDVVHERVLSMLADGQVQGLRIDHIDGLFDPGAYCRRLRSEAKERGCELYLVLEKILAEHESLRDGWGADGTTGYDFLAEVIGLFVEPRAELPLRALYRRQVGERLDLEASFYRAKCETIDTQLSAELQVLANMLDRIGERNTWTRDFTLSTLRAALREIVASFPVYRTYVTSTEGAADEDRRDIAWAVAQARKRAPSIDDSVFDFVERAMLTELEGSLSSGYDPLEVKRFALKLQQYTGPVMAKAVEDTAFYRHPLLLCLADVGVDPKHFAVSVAAFHHRQQQRALRFPASMLTTSTHDTKRGEDARARIAVLSEMSGAWARRVSRWNQLNRSRRSLVGNERVPTGRDVYLIYQSLVGSWPAGAQAPEEDFVERLVAYTEKALREAKDRTGWDRPHQEYEQAVERFIRLVMRTERPNKFLEDFVSFQAEVSRLGMLNSLSQLVLRLTVPGVPDQYQGTEDWDLSFVDPDNRRPVDFEARRDQLEAIVAAGAAGVAEYLDSWQDARIKLYLMHRLLELRRAHPTVFASGSYRALEVEGQWSEHVVAFQRVHDSGVVTVVVGRLYRAIMAHSEWPLAEAWQDTLVHCEGAIGADALTGEDVGEGPLELSHWLTKLPVGVAFSKR